MNAIWAIKKEKEILKLFNCRKEHPARAHKSTLTQERQPFGKNGHAHRNSYYPESGTCVNRITLSNSPLEMELAYV